MTNWQGQVNEKSRRSRASPEALISGALAMSGRKIWQIFPLRIPVTLGAYRNGPLPHYRLTLTCHVSCFKTSSLLLTTRPCCVVQILAAFFKTQVEIEFPLWQCWEVGPEERCLVLIGTTLWMEGCCLSGETTHSHGIECFL